MKTELPEKTLFEKLTTRGYKLSWKDWAIDKVVALFLITIIALPVLVILGILGAIIRVCWFIVFQWN